MRAAVALLAVGTLLLAIGLLGDGVGFLVASSVVCVAALGVLGVRAATGSPRPPVEVADGAEQEDGSAG
jgi:hypothetical protein